jgi:hypothetical protein
MAKEFGEGIIKRVISEQATRNSVPIRTAVEGWETILNYQIKIKAPEIEDVLQKKWKKERDEAFRWIEESNTIPDGKLDLLGQLHKIMNQRNAAVRWKIFDADYNYESKKKKRRTGGWGPYGNLTREQYQKRVDWLTKVRNSRQPPPEYLFPENEDTNP